jgi:putative aminopeptidase FrvX
MAEIIEELSRLNGVSGNEDLVRNYIIEKISSRADDVRVDSIGNVIALKKGRKSDKKIMITSNMDEAGFIVSGITDKGYLKIKNVGNIDPRVIISKKVTIGNNVKGIIGMKAIHLQQRSEREKTVDVSKIFVDIGASSKANALKRVSIGDYVAFDTEFSQTESVVSGKALDRAGCVCLLKAINKKYLYDTYFVFCAQKETGERGARVAAHRIQPDIALVINTIESADMYGTDEKNINAHLGEGAILDLMDKTSIKNNALMKSINILAEKENIKIQKKHSIEGISAGGVLQTAAGGVFVAGIGIPCRYSHTPICMMNKKDIDSASALTKLFLEKIGDISNGIIN